MSVANQKLKLVINSATTFDVIDRTLGELACAKGDNTAVTAPLIPGEPEFAHWVCDDTAVSYSFNPVVYLRVLAFSGPSAANLKISTEQQLDCLGQTDVKHLLGAENHKDVLRGLYAAAELNTIHLLGAVNELRVHVNQRVSQTAARTAEKLSLDFVQLGAERLAEEQRRHPERSAVFPRLGDADTRRNTLLWLLHDHDQANPEIVKVLRTALVDSDWRVRVTAMLVAARLHAQQVWLDIRRMDLPTTGRSGLDRRWRSLLGALRKAVLAELADEPRPTLADERSRLMHHLCSLVSGEDDGIHDEPYQWIDAWLSPPEED